MSNIEIRKAITEAKVKHWEVADELGVHPSTLCAMLRRELAPDKKAEVLDAIKNLAER